MTKNTPWECFTLPSTLATQTLIRKNKNPYKSWHPWLWLILRKKHTANMNRCPVWPFQSTPHFSDQSIWKKVRIIARVVASGTSTPLLFDYTITKPIYIYIYSWPSEDNMINTHVCTHNYACARHEAGTQGLEIMQTKDRWSIGNRI